MSKIRFGLVFLAILLFPLVSPSFAGISNSSAPGTDQLGSASAKEQSKPDTPLTIFSKGNENFLDLGQGLSIKLDPSFGRTVGNQTVYDYSYLRKLPVSLIINFKNLQDRVDAVSKVTAAGGILNLSYTALPFIAVTVPAENVSVLAGGTMSLTPFSDVKVSAFLDESVPIIKPPVQWASLEQNVGKGVNGTGISIAIVDTGIWEDHPDFYFENGTSKITFTKSVVPGENANDYFGHGTHVAGIVAGTGKASGYKYVGVAPGASLFNIKVLDHNGAGYESWVIAGIEFAVNHTASVINLSLGANVNTDGTDPMSLACDWAVEQGVTVVVAAGNSGPGGSSVGTPGGAREVITVGATTKQDEIAGFSSRGPTADFRIKPDVVAPGVNITAPASVRSYLWNYLFATNPSTIVGNYYYTISGTSMASPHVAGVAALLRELHPGWSPAFVKAALMNSARDLNQTWCTQGSGRVEAYSAAVVPVLTVDSSLSFGMVKAGRYVQNTTIYNAGDCPQTISSVTLGTYQISNRITWPFVSTDIMPPVTIPAGGSIQTAVTLDLPQDAITDYYDGVLALGVNDIVLRVPYYFIYQSTLLLRAMMGNTFLNAQFIAYDVSDPNHEFATSLFAPSAKFLVPSGTYVVHALSFELQNVDQINLDVNKMFLLTEVVEVGKGSTVAVNLTLDTARAFSVPNTGIDGRAFSLRDSERQIVVYFKNVTIAGMHVAGYGTVETLYLSDTEENIYFNMELYFSDPEDPLSLSSDTFYSLSWAMYGVDSTTSTNLTYDEDNLAKYTLKYKADGPPKSNLWSCAFVLAPRPPGETFMMTIAIAQDVYAGMVQNFYVKGVDWNRLGGWNRELIWACYERNDMDPYLWRVWPNFCWSMADLRPFDDANKTTVFMQAPYQTSFTVQSDPNDPGQTIGNFTIKTADVPLTKIWAGVTMATAYRDETSLPLKWLSSSFAGPEAFSFPSVESGAYTVNVTQLTFLALWRRVEVLAQFTKPSADETPPSMTQLDVNPKFNSDDSSLHVSFSVDDNVGVRDAILWYSYDSSADWTNVGLTRSPDRFEANVPLTQLVHDVSLRIKAYDYSNNSVQYTLTPVSTRSARVELLVPSTWGVTPSAYVKIPLTASDHHLLPYAVQAYVNGSFLGDLLVIDGILGGAAGEYYKFPYVACQLHFSFFQDMSPTYYPSSAEMNVDVGWPITFKQVGVGADFQGAILTVDGIDYGLQDMPKTFYWGVDSNHTFAYKSGLVSASGAKQYDWLVTRGLSTLQSGSITFTGSGDLTAYYMTRVHDIVTTNVASDRAWVYQGRSAKINVIVENLGNFNETVTLTLYYNLTANQVVSRQTTELLVGERKTLTFEWNTVGIAYCRNYTITAVASIPADITPTDNTLGNIEIRVRIMGDLNGDDKIDIRDIAEAARAFGAYAGFTLTTPQWNPNADINQDGKVDIRDLVILAKNFGITYP